MNKVARLMKQRYISATGSFGELVGFSKQETSIGSRRGKNSMLHDFKGATWRGPRKGEGKQQVDKSRGEYLRSGKRAEVVISGV